MGPKMTRVTRVEPQSPLWPPRFACPPRSVTRALKATMTVAASSKIELALCFEDVAKNIFKSPDGTMSGCVRSRTPSDDRNGSHLFSSHALTRP